MPKLPTEILDSPFYLYSSADDAKKGAPFGGTGFFVGYPTGLTEPKFFTYAITNWHVAVRDGASVIRVNKAGGGVDIFEFDPAEWFFVPGGHDVAIVSGTHLPVNASHLVRAIDTRLFLTKDDVAEFSIGAGEDIFMLGRFVDHDGGVQNVPAARFGNLSVMPQPIEQPTGAKNLSSFILDVHSRTGYSGSPVFVYRTYGSDLSTANLNIEKKSHFMKVLGLHWGQFPEAWEIESGKTLSVEGASISGDAKYVKGMSGMTLAIPSWDILKYLEMPKFQQERAAKLEAIQKRQAV